MSTASVDITKSIELMGDCTQKLINSEYSLEELRKVMETQKEKNYPRDQLGYANEIFWPNVSGQDFKLEWSIKSN